MAIDWASARLDYVIHHELTFADIASKYHAALGSIWNRAAQERWTEQRKTASVSASSSPLTTVLPAALIVLPFRAICGSWSSSLAARLRPIISLWIIFSSALTSTRSLNMPRQRPNDDLWGAGALTEGHDDRNCWLVFLGDPAAGEIVLNRTKQRHHLCSGEGF